MGVAELLRAPLAEGTRCYACRKLIEARDPFYVFELAFAGRTLEGSHHSRSVRQHVCSRLCLARSLTEIGGEVRL